MGERTYDMSDMPGNPDLPDGAELVKDDEDGIAAGESAKKQLPQAASDDQRLMSACDMPPVQWQNGVPQCCGDPMTQHEKQAAAAGGPKRYVWLCPKCKRWFDTSRKDPRKEALR